MATYKKILKLNSKLEYYLIHLNLINAIGKLNLTNKEIEVLSTFMQLEGDLAEDRFSTLSRKKVKNKLELSDGGLSNYIKTLRDKDCIIDSEDHIEINPALFPDDTEQLYMFKILYA